MIMLLRRFNDEGLSAFRKFIEELNSDDTVATKSKPAPFHMLEDPTFTELVHPEADCADVTFKNRLEVARYLDSLLNHAKLPEMLADVKLWSWLSLRFFDQLRPLTNGVVADKRVGLQEARFVPSDVLDSPKDRSNRYHRHLLRNPFHIYRLAASNPSAVMCFLVQPVHEPGDFIEQFASRQIYMRNLKLTSMLTHLCVDPQKQTIRPKASSKARRLEDVLQQFDCTWDLSFVPRDQLVAMLPDEFQDLRNAAHRDA